MSNNPSEFESGRKGCLRYIIIPVVVAIIGCAGSVIGVVGGAITGLLPPGLIYQVVCEQDYLNLECAPIANFSAYPECGEPPFEVSFVNKSVGEIDRYIWDFGDGTDDIRVIPRDHIYTAAGRYSVELLVSGPGGADTKTIEINAERCTPPTRTPTPVSPGRTPTPIPPIHTATPTRATPTPLPTTHTAPPVTLTTPAPNTTYPDLVISSIVVNPAAPTTDDLITFTVVVANAGSAQANATTLNVRVGGETTGENFNIPSLAPGGQHTITRQENLSVAQTYGITVAIDPNNTIFETNNANNSAAQNFTVTSTSDESASNQNAPPDLVIVSITTTPGTPTTRDPITFTLTVRNDGGTTSVATTASIRVGGETFGQSYSIPALAPGQTATVSRQETLTTAQNYRANATIDPNNTVSESNENNNAGYVDFMVSN